MLNQGLFSSNTWEWGTPKELFDEWNKEFNFTTDPCTSPDNPLGCKIFYTVEQNGLDWSKSPWYGNVYINPPYGRMTKDWVRLADEYSINGLGNVVMLLPARTDVKWFHDYIYNKPNVDVHFFKGRLKFTNQNYPKPFPAPFPSMKVTFRMPGVEQSQQNRQ